MWPVDPRSREAWAWRASLVIIGAAGVSAVVGTADLVRQGTYYASSIRAAGQVDRVTVSESEILGQTWYRNLEPQASWYAPSTDVLMVIGSAARPESDRVVELWEQALRASGDPAIERWYVGADESWSPSVPMPTGSAVRRLAIRNREVYRARCGIIGVPMSLLLTADGFVKLAVSGVPSLETLDEGIFLLGHLTDKSTSVRRGQPFDSLLAR